MTWPYSVNSSHTRNGTFMWDPRQLDSHVGTPLGGTPIPLGKYEGKGNLSAAIGTMNNEAGAYTRPLLCSTQAVSVSEPVCDQLVADYDRSIQWRCPTYPT